jgi:hypothetical protein
MFLSACLTLVLSQQPPEGFAPQSTSELMTLRLRSAKSGLSFDWSDAEDRVRGTISPHELAAGEPFTVSVAVGSFASGDFDGPVTLGLEQVEGPFRVLETVAPSQAQPRVWKATFTPPDQGHYLLKVTFKSSHQKPLQGSVEVGISRVSSTTALGLGVVLVLAGLSYGLFLLFGKSPGASDAPAPPTT